MKKLFIHCSIIQLKLLVYEGCWLVTKVGPAIIDSQGLPRLTVSSDIDQLIGNRDEWLTVLVIFINEWPTVSGCE